ncbi:hypothetical protein CEXT_420361 [Caerostris extrusa]|uniref:Alpha-latrotoxin n=1 Tax=Caerostris extrusa TaxID=172846 RepID=A0AAV4QTQ8_CAEEX|nr:hypothetical protein CEXT_420361 [Caerostris extrusa]
MSAGQGEMCRDVNYGVNINKSDEFNGIPLHHACWKSSIAYTELLLKMDADIHTPQSGKKPLYEVYRHDKVECAEILLKYHANVNAVATNEMTPLCVACEYASIPCIKLLLNIGTDVNFATVRGTALHEACLKGGPECILLLIYTGTDLNARDFEGTTPLHTASFRNHTVCLGLFLKGFS